MGNILVLGLIIWMGVGLGLSIIKNKYLINSSISAAPEVKSVQKAKRHSLAYYESITKYNIFSNSEDSDKSSGPAPVATPQYTDTDIQLKGTIVDQNTGYYLAVIKATGEQEENLYRPGDKIGSVELVEVHRDFIVILKGGKEVKVELTGNSPQSGNRSVKQTTLSEYREQASGDSTTAVSSAFAKQTGPDSWVVSRDEISKQMENLNTLLSQIRIQPHFENGQPSGYKLTSIRRTSPLYQLGLQRGDVIQSVNGVTVGRPEDLINMYRQLQQLDNVTLELMRKGEQVRLNYSFR